MYELRTRDRKRNSCADIPCPNKPVSTLAANLKNYTGAHIIGRRYIAIWSYTDINGKHAIIARLSVCLPVLNYAAISTKYIKLICTYAYSPGPLLLRAAGRFM